MNDIAIRVHQLAKRYTLGVRRAHYRTLRESIVEAITSPLRRKQRVKAATFWALKGIDLEVRRGEVLGLIGRNGAGKTTLLKLLSRITEPTSGYADIWGRVGSLLEVGTGFHPELTGRENIYLNGAILGMKHAEIERKMDSIVEFAEVERFLETPVKRYSSGMYLRLAFAVAAHLEPDILLVDEVLAVGDASFQSKCLGKMNEVARQERTVVFVSHNMSAMAQLCRTIVWLEGGQIRKMGPAKEVIGDYLSSEASTQSYWENKAPAKDTAVRIDSAKLTDAAGEVTNLRRYSQPFRVEIAYTVARPIHDLSVVCRVTDQLGNVIWTSWDTDANGWRGRIRQPGRYTSTCVVEGSLLRPGRYFVTVGARLTNSVFEMHTDILALDISAVDFPLNLDRVGMVTPVFEWSIEPVASRQTHYEAVAP